MNFSRFCVGMMAEWLGWDRVIPAKAGILGIELEQDEFLRDSHGLMHLHRNPLLREPTTSFQYS